MNRATLHDSPARLVRAGDRPAKPVGRGCPNGQMIRKSLCSGHGDLLYTEALALLSVGQRSPMCSGMKQGPTTAGQFVSRCEYRSVRGSRNIGMPNFFKTAATSGCQKISKVPSERQSIAIRTPSTGCWGWASQRATAMRSGSVRKPVDGAAGLAAGTRLDRGSVLERARTKL
jgi:hypothetical protein